MASILLSSNRQVIPESHLGLNQQVLPQPEPHSGFRKQVLPQPGSIERVTLCHTKISTNKSYLSLADQLHAPLKRQPPAGSKNLKRKKHDLFSSSSISAFFCKCSLRAFSNHFLVVNIESGQYLDIAAYIDLVTVGFVIL